MRVDRIKENEFYILYKRAVGWNDDTCKYVIYRTDEYGGDMFKEFRYLTEAKRIFNKATKEAIEHNKIMQEAICKTK